MGMNVGSGRNRGVQGEINITPLIDVVLVLLIIFMVLIPSSLKQLTAAVPQKTEPTRQHDPEPSLVVAIAADGELALNGARVQAGNLAEKLRARLEGKREKVVFFEIDDAIHYGVAVRLMDLAAGAGAKALGVVTRDERALTLGAEKN